MKIKIGVSQRHVHLTLEDVEILFGKGYVLHKKNDLSQKGQYSCEEQVTIKGPKNSIEKVRILGSLRSKTQVEVSRTDCYKLGITAPVRDSGDLDDATEITVIGPKGSITKKAAIIATRHIHINPKDALEYGITEDKVIALKVEGEKSGTLEGIHVKIREGFVFEIHLDTDDANAFLINNGDVGELIIK